MPTSEYEPTATLTPEAPDGYADPTEFRYPLPVVLGLVAVLTPYSQGNA